MGDAQQWMDALGMSPLPEEGGWYAEVYRSEEIIPAEGLPGRFSGPRCFSTSIYYLLKSDEFSAFHRIKQDEIWHFYEGSSLTLHLIDQVGNYRAVKLGRDYRSGERFQVAIGAGDLFAATVNERDAFSLVGCTVAPGFEFEDFEAPGRARLLELYPEHEEIISRLTR